MKKQKECIQHRFRERQDSFEYECKKCGLRTRPSFYLHPHCDVGLVGDPLQDANGNWNSMGYVRLRYGNRSWNGPSLLMTAR